MSLRCVRYGLVSRGEKELKTSSLGGCGKIGLVDGVYEIAIEMILEASRSQHRIARPKATKRTKVLDVDAKRNVGDMWMEEVETFKDKFGAYIIIILNIAIHKHTFANAS